MADSTNPYASFLGDQEPYFVLRSTADRIQELTAGLTAEQLAAPPQPGKWSIHQIVAHLADCELVFQTRARMIMFQNNPTLVSFDQESWVLGWMREHEPWEETFLRFRVLRNSILRLFLNAEGHDLVRYGTHTERGVQTIRDYVDFLAGHDINHLQQIERARGVISAK
jgi:hypothetical protein